MNRKTVIKTSLILISVMALITLGLSWHKMFDASEPSNLISCTNHIDVNFDMVCDACQKSLSAPIDEKLEIVETTSDDGKKVKVQGYIPEDIEVISKKVEKESAITLAQEHIKDISSGDVLYAYDISLMSSDIEYQPENENKSVNVTISNLDMENKDEIRLLHIMDDGSYELIKPTKLTANSISFDATSFSTYIVIKVASHDVTFDGSNFTVQNIKGKELTNGATIIDGVDFNFVITPNKGYGVTNVTVTNSSGTSISGITETGFIKSKTINISNVTQDMIIKVTTVAAPAVTTQPVTTKVKANQTATFSVTATNATEFVWQYRENGNEYWKDVTSSVGIASTNGQTSTLTTVATTISMNEYEFRCLLANANYTGDYRVKTNEALLVVSEDTMIHAVEYDIPEDSRNYSVDGIYYITLADAFASIEGNTGTIIVERTGFTDSKAITIENGKTITLDTNGKTVTRTSTITVANGGTLEITGTGTLNTSSTVHLITNSGTVNVKGACTLTQTATSGNYTVIAGSGNISITENAKLSSVTYPAIYQKDVNTSVINISAGTFTGREGICFRGATLNITGGTFTHSYDYAVSNRSTGTINISNATITSTGTYGVENNGAGTINITSGTITGKTIGITNNGAGTVNVKGGTVTGTTNGVYNGATGKINITGGTVKATGGVGAYNNTGTLVIGTSGDPISTSVPEIQGTTYGVQGESIFYDGLIKGETAAFSAAPKTTEAKYAVYTENSDKTAFLKKDIVDVTLSENTYTYDGNVKTPVITVKWNNEELIRDIDYKLTFSNNINAGTAKVIVEGKGSYTGTVEKTYTINKATIIGNIEIVSENILRVDVSKISPQTANLTYQWWLSDTADGQNKQEILGATGNTYEPNADAFDKYIGVSVYATLENYKDKEFTAMLNEEYTGIILVQKPKLVEKTYVYNGHNHKAEVTNYVETLMNIKGDVEVNAGNYQVTISLINKDKYSWSDHTTDDVILNWSIEKTSITIDITMEDFYYGGTKPEPTVIGNKEDSMVRYYYTETETNTGGTLWSNVPNSLTLDVGTYYMYAVIDESTNYYSATSTPVPFTISKLGINVDLKVGEKSYNTEWTNKNVEAIVTLPDSLKELTYVYYKTEEMDSYEAHRNTKLNGNKLTITFDDPISSDVTFVGVNVAGKPITYTVTKQINIERTLPRIDSMNKEVIDGIIKVTAKASDEESGIKYYATSFGAKPETWTELLTAKESIEIKLEVPINQIYYLWVKDAAGNIIAEGKEIVHYEDIMPPEGTIKVNGNEVEGSTYVNDRDVTIDITAKDDTTKTENIEMKILTKEEYENLQTMDNISWEKYREEVAYRLTNGDGIKTLYLLLRDELGNVSLVLPDNSKERATYKVHYYLENTDNENYSEYYVATKSGMKNSEIELTNLKKRIEGTTYVKTTLTPNGAVATKATIAEDGSTNIYLYYDRNEYTLTLENNENITSVTGAGTYKYGKEVEINANIENKAGYTYNFINWSSNNKEKINNVETATATITIPANDMILTANASKSANEYIVTFNANGGKIIGTGTESITQKVNFGESYGISIPKVEQEGYRFLGWYTESNELVTEETIISIAQNHTIEAKWEKVYTLTVNPNGAKWEDTNTSEVRKFIGKSNDSVEIPELLPKEGNVTILFDGNNGKIDGKDSYILTKPYNMIQGELTEDSKGTYAGNTYVFAENNDTLNVISYAYIGIDECQIPVRAGHRFTNWNDAKDGSGNIYELGTYYKEGVSLYADWKQIMVNYKVQHWLQNVDGNDDENATNYTLTEDNIDNLIGAELTTVIAEVKTITGFTAPATKSLTLYSDGERVVNYYYKRNSYTVTLNKGTGIASVTGANTYRYGASVTINATVANGYRWGNWTGDQAAQTKEYTFIMPASPVTNTANGIENIYDTYLSATTGEVTYDATNTFTITSAIPGTIAVRSNNTSCVTITEGNGATITANTVSTIRYKGMAATTTANTITIEFTPADLVTYLPKTLTFTVTQVKPAIVTVPSANDLTYNGASQTGVNGGIGYALTGHTGTNAVNYTATATLTSTRDYVWNDGTTTPKQIPWTIKQKALTVTAAAQTVTYGTAITQGTNKASISGQVDGHTLTAVTLTQSTTSATTTGKITPSAATIKNASGTDVTANYSISYVDGTLTINRTGIAVPGSPSAKTYNGSAQNHGVTVPTGTSIVAASSTQSATNVGTYNIVLQVDGNHKWSDGTTGTKTITWTINKKAVTVTAKAQTITYGGSISTGTSYATLSGGVSDHTLTAVTLTQSTTSATTTGKITPSAATIKNGSGTDVTSNYTITYATGTLTINQANGYVNLSATSGSITYPTATTKTFTVSSTHGGTLSVASSDTNVATASVDGTTVTITAKKAGSTTITVTCAATTNYKVATATYALTVNYEIYTITYNLAGGTVATANPTSYTVATATFTLNNPTRTHYTFLGWTGSNGTTASTNVSIEQGSIGNKNYTANWKQNVYVPSNLTATNGTTALGQTINISWGSNSNLSGTTYELEVSSDNSSWTNLYTGTATSYSHTGLAIGNDNGGSNQTRYYKVRAKNSEGTYSAYTAVATGNTLASPSASISITSNGVNSGTNNVSISWPAVSGAKSYVLSIFDGYDYRSYNIGNVTSWNSNDANIYPTAAQISAWNGTSDPFRWDGTGTDFAASHNNLYVKSANSTYNSYSYYTWIHLASVDSAGSLSGGIWAGATSLCSGTVDTDAPNTPAAPIVGTRTSTTIAVSASATDKYMTASSPGSGMASSGYRYKINSTESSWTTTSYTYTGLTPNTSYSLYVQAKDNNGNYSGYSTAVSARTLANIPTSLSASNGTSGSQITISWGANSNPSGTTYELQVSSDNSTWTNLYTGTATSYSHTGLSYNMTRYYRVRAKNANNEYTSYTSSVTGKTMAQYSISYNLNGGSVATANPTLYTPATATFTLNNPTRAGYTFAGWTGTGLSSATTSVTITKGSTGNRSYTANWTADTYYVTYDANGGSGAPAQQAFVFDSGAKISTTTPTRTGYTFSHWVYSGITFAPGAAIPTGWGSFTLTAQWSVVNYTIGYTLNGGSVSGNPSTYNVETATFTLNNPTRAGFAFTGWTGTGLSSATTSVTITKGSTGNRSYTANWRAQSFDITLGTTSYTYDGNAKTPGVTVKAGGATLTSGTHYTVSYSNNTNAGTGTVTVTGKGDYTGVTGTATFTINKASGYSTLSSNNGTKVYGSSSVQFTASGTGTLSVEETTSTAATVSISGGSGGSLATVTISNLASLNAGTKVIVKVTAAETTNYTSASSTYELGITRADGYITLNYQSHTTDGEDTDYTSVESHHGGTITAEETTSYGVRISVSGTTINFSGLSNLDDGSVVRVRITSGQTTNYNEASATYTITIDGNDDPCAPGHSYELSSYRPSHTIDYHTWECTVCGYEITESHSWSMTDSAYNDRVEYYECDVCGYVKTTVYCKCVYCDEEVSGTTPSLCSYCSLGLCGLCDDDICRNHCDEH